MSNIANRIRRESIWLVFLAVGGCAEQSSAEVFQFEYPLGEESYLVDLGATGVEVKSITMTVSGVAHMGSHVCVDCSNPDPEAPCIETGFVVWTEVDLRVRADGLQRNIGSWYQETGGDFALTDAEVPCSNPCDPLFDSGICTFYFSSNEVPGSDYWYCYGLGEDIDIGVRVDSYGYVEFAGNPIITIEYGQATPVDGQKWGTVKATYR